MKIKVEPQESGNWYASFSDGGLWGGRYGDTRSEAISSLRKAYLDYKLGARQREELKARAEEMEVDW